MITQNHRTVIIGAGQAGVHVADSLRAAGYQGRITMLTDEVELPYQRPQLSKDLLAAAEADPLPLRPESFYAENDIELLRGVSVTAIDTEARRIVLAGARVMAYDDLVIATGTRARTLHVPGAELPGVHTMRTLNDALHLRQDLRSARKVVVVGAGFIGLEVAAMARGMDLEVTVLPGPGAPLGRAVSASTSAWFAQHHRGAAVDIVDGEGAVGFEGENDRVSAVFTASGARFDADLVIVGIGAVPNVELAEASGIEVSCGVVVDEHLRTSAPGVWSLGDCAVLAGANGRIESVQNATDQGRLLADNLLATLNGTELTGYSTLPWFWSHQGGAKLQIAGLRTAECQNTLVLGAPEKAKFSVLCFNADDELTAVESVNSAADHMAARKILSSGIPLTREIASSEGFTLKAHSRAALAAV